MDLSVIATTFHHLETLSIEVHCERDMKGSLHRLHNLQTLSLTLPALALVPSCLPYAATSSLKSLSIIRKSGVSELFDVISDRGFGPDMDLNPFLHLKHVVMIPFIPACVEILEHHVHGLESLEIKLGTYAIDEFIELTNLRDLQSLKIHLYRMTRPQFPRDSVPWYVGKSAFLALKVAAISPTLRHLEFIGGFDFRLSFALAELEKLESLRWNVPGMEFSWPESVRAS
jgi:hypothetical protein